MLYRLKNTIQAEQFLPPHDNIPKGIMNIRKNRAGFWTGIIRNTQGSIATVRRGDWILYPNDVPAGRYLVLTDENFKQRYEPI